MEILMKKFVIRDHRTALKLNKTIPIVTSFEVLIRIFFESKEGLFTILILESNIIED